MVSIEKRPVLNMMTLGAVATGNMNAHEALIVAGIMSNFGSIPAPSAPAASIGISNVVVAVLLVVSVRNVTAKHIASIIANTGSTANPVSESPII